MFIDNEKVNVLGNSEYIQTPTGAFPVNYATGLLGTPVLEQYIVRFDMIFEPRLNVGETVLLDSITDNNYNGLYKIIGVKHRGMISESVCGDAITTGEFVFTKLGVPVAPQTAAS